MLERGDGRDLYRADDFFRGGGGGGGGGGSSDLLGGARSLAKELTRFFLENGNYALASGPTSLGGTPGSPSAITTKRRDANEVETAFAGISVQSVGYTVGKGKAAEVDIYVIAGSKRALKSLSTVTNGVKVNVLKMGRIVVKPEAASAASTNKGNIYVRKERIAGGTSCAPAGQNYSGTFGGIVRKNGAKTLFAISNNHVFAGCNHMPVGMPILAPSNMDGKPNARAPGEICRHSEIVELRSGDPSFVSPCEMDVSLAEIVNPSVVTSWQGDDVNGYDTPTKVTAPESGMRVKKFGRTTGFTKGTIRAYVEGPTPIGYVQDHFKSRIWFKNIWTIQADPGDQFALGGDSGSLVVTEDGNFCVGLLFAADSSGSFGWIIPMDLIASHLKIAPVGKHGT